MKLFKLAVFLGIFISTGLLSKAEIKIPEVKTETLNINKNENYEIIKPVFIDNVKFKDVNDEINRLINVKEIGKLERSSCIEDSEECENYMYQVTPEIIYADDNVISLVIDRFIYTGGAHGNGRRYSFLADRKTGKLITNTLKNNNKEIFDKIQKFIETNSLGIFFDFEEYTADGLLEKAVVYQTGKNTISVMYMDYAIAPYIIRSPEFIYNVQTKKLYFLNNYVDSAPEKIELK